MGRSFSLDVFKAVEDRLEDNSRDVELAMRGSLIKHGEVTTDPVRGCLNLAEEVGEAAAEALDATREGVTARRKLDKLIMMCDELAQVAGYAILLMSSMKGEIHKLNKEVGSGGTGS